MLWTWPDVVRGILYKGRPFLDFYGGHYGGGPYLKFLLLEGTEVPRYNHNADYVKFSDNVINGWWHNGLEDLLVYINSLDRPEKGLSRYGNTIIPPESMSEFINIVKNHTSEHFINTSEGRYNALLNLLQKAQDEGKYIICYGV